MAQQCWSVSIMKSLNEIQVGSRIRGLLPNDLFTVESIKWFGNTTVQVIGRDSNGKLREELIYGSVISNLEIEQEGRAWPFDADGNLFKLTLEALRIRLAYLFEPLLAVTTSDIEPLPHQISAVYEKMLDRQPLRFLLADDPGAVQGSRKCRCMYFSDKFYYPKVLPTKITAQTICSIARFS